MKQNNSPSHWPFIYQQYNVLAFNKSLLLPIPRVVRLLNAVIEGLNSTPRLPKYIFLLPDSDIIEGTDHFNFGVMHMLQEQVMWLFAQLEKTVNRRRDDLKVKRPGAISMSTYEPHFIWIAMIDRPFTTDYRLKKILGLENRFNELLRNMVEKEKYHYIMHLQLPQSDPQLFTCTGRLSSHGKNTFWSAFDELLCRFDAHRIELTAAEMKKNIEQSRTKNLHFGKH